MSTSLAGQAVVVIGGSSGMGLAVAEHCSQQGARVVIASRSREKLAAAVKQVSGAQAVVADISRESDVAKLFGDLDIVNHVYVSAGAPVPLDLATASDDAILGGFRERVLGAIYVARHARPKMRAGSITLTTGVVIHMPKMKRPIAAGIAGGVDAMAKHLAIELAPIRVNVIAPGLIDTPLTESYFGANKAETMAAMGAKHPVGRIGNVTDIAQAVLHLMMNDFVTGQIMFVDGGSVL